ncbi:MAG: phosphatase PAP2 family protein [Coriobacteriales bacterium]|jgi:undecaprenyl-diphosphatase|nr:phosphatase PAP2 family protein [Coriobacteriales bacterium]
MPYQPRHLALHPDIAGPAKVRYAHRVAAAVLALLFLTCAISVWRSFYWVGAFDGVVQSLVYPLQSLGLAGFFTCLTFLGETPSVLLWAVLICLVLLCQHNWRKATLVAAATAVGEISLYLVKFLVGRPRPQGHNLIALPDSASFISGHAFGSCLIGLMLAALLFGYLRRRGLPRAVQCLPYLLLSLVALLIAFSRLYLGVHWPSDVLGGWLWSLAIVILISPALIRPPRLKEPK